MPQHCNHTARSPYVGRTVALRWPWGGIRFLSCLGCLENCTVASRRPCGDLTVAVRQTCNSCKNREVAVRSPAGLLAVTLRFLISWIVPSSCGRRNICDHNYHRPQDLTIFKNHVLQTVDRRTVRWPYGGSVICDRDIRLKGSKTFFSVHVTRASLLWHHLTNDSRLHRFFLLRYWKICHHGHEFNLRWYSPFQNTTAHL